MIQRIKLFCVFSAFFGIFFVCMLNKELRAVHNDDDFFNNNAILKSEVVYLLKEYFKEAVQIESTELVSNLKSKSSIVRINIKPVNLIQEELPKSCILKQTLSKKSFDQDEEALRRFSQEWAGLQFLNKIGIESPYFPKLYGGSQKNHFVLIEDLGKK